MLAARFWCLRPVLALYWEPSWSEWEASWRLFLLCSEFLHFLCLLYNCCLLPPHPGYGSVIQMYPGGGPVRAGVESFGFPAHFHDMLHDFPVCHVNALLAGTLDTTAKDHATGRTRLFLRTPLQATIECWDARNQHYHFFFYNLIKTFRKL